MGFRHVLGVSDSRGRSYRIEVDESEADELRVRVTTWDGWVGSDYTRPKKHRRTMRL